MSFSGEGSVGGGLTDVFQCRTNSIAHDGRRSPAELRTGASRPANGARHGLPLSIARSRHARHAGHRLSPTAEGDLRSWVLLASPSVQTSDHTGDSSRFLADQVRSKQGQGSSQPARPPATGLEGNRRLGVLDSPPRLARETPARFPGGLKATLRILIRPYGMARRSAAIVKADPAVRFAPAQVCRGEPHIARAVRWRRKRHVRTLPMLHHRVRLLQRSASACDGHEARIAALGSCWFTDRS